MSTSEDEAVERIFIIEREAKACGSVTAELVNWGTPDYGRIYAMLMECRTRCLACPVRMDKFVASAFVEFYATKNMSMSLPVPICSNCYEKNLDELKVVARSVIGELLPNIPVRFVQQ